MARLIAAPKTSFVLPPSSYSRAILCYETGHRAFARSTRSKRKAIAHMNAELQPLRYKASLHRSIPPLYLFFILPILLVMAFVIFKPIKVLPRISLAPGYSLVDQQGKRFTSESVRGSLTLYTFMHSRCTSPCVPTSATLAGFQAELLAVPTADIPLQFVTIFVDPEEATPAVLRAQAQLLGVDPSHWHFVTGAARQLKQVVGAGFSTYYAQEANGAYTVDPVFVLVDGWNIIRAVYRTASPDVATIKRDLRLVAEEALKSTGVNRYAYEAAHLFLCYPQ